MAPPKYSRLEDAEKCPEPVIKDDDEIIFKNKEKLKRSRNDKRKQRSCCGILCEVLILLTVLLLCIMLIDTLLAKGKGCIFSKLYNYTRHSGLFRPSSKLSPTPEYDQQMYIEVIEIDIVEDVVYQQIPINDNHQKTLQEIPIGHQQTRQEMSINHQQTPQEIPINQKKTHQGISKVNNDRQCNIMDNGRKFDCYPESPVTQEKCEARGCCYHAVNGIKENPVGVPYCFYPLNYPGYVVTRKEKKAQGFDVFLSRPTQSYYPDDVMDLKMEVKMEKTSRLHVKIFDANNSRWEVPLGVPVSPSPVEDVGDNLYDVTVADVGQPFNFNITRTGTANKILLLQTTGAFIFADQFLQLSYFLSSNYIYGLGEHRDTLVHSMDWSRFTMWNRDQPPTEKANLYGDHPFYLNIEDGGSSHGVFLLNSNAMDVILQPAPAITWRTIGGVIDLYMFLGPSPNDVIQQYTEVIGHSFMPPYWSLGFHVCRWGYATVNETLGVVNRIGKYGIPQDTQWNDLDYMDSRRDFTTNLTGFGDQGAMVEDLHNRGMHYIMLVDPGISSTSKAGTYEPLDLGLKMDIFVKDHNGKPLEGKVWPGFTYFPDFTHPNSQQYWTTIVKNFHDKVAFDGMWIDMNEISNFVIGSTSGCPDNNLENPPYLPDVNGGSLRANTICTSAQQHLSTQYNIHNMYGYTETVASYHALQDIRGKRPFVISRSTFSGQGHYGGHWTGDNAATYHDMYRSISEIIKMNMFGITMVGADICGFRENTSEQLCQRWHQLGAFYTFSRNHNTPGTIPQDPASFGPALAESTRKVYLIRYKLLPYLYTLIHKSNMMGDTVLRPLFFEYPKDSATYTNDRQFLWGSALLISPVLEQDVTSLSVYFPADMWYDYYTGELITSEGGGKILQTPLDKINLHVRGGYILPWQYPNTTTIQSRKNKFGLLVALNSTRQAEGDLFWDDGDTIDTVGVKLYNTILFNADKNGVYSSPLFIGYKDEPMLLGNVTVFGLQQQPSTVTVNGQSANYNFNSQYKVLYVTNFSSTLLQPIKILWTF
ncbi:lysosomal alpha-glucosidase isoform X1 [Patella vulgata]|uniref:lysosomal alpha-glucosidase isoform X1 n=1 Tax=Patella vulgata TaxID=6465 RepID=UPI0024A9421A|nr:lysosomal alpha-glucosidase isoform X1 [Patella vulgata]